MQADPITYTRVVELLAEGCGSVGWNLANNSIGQLVTLGLPEEGVEEMYGHTGHTVMAGTAVQGGGQAVPVEGGYRVTGRWSFGSGCQESHWMLGSFQILDDGKPRARPRGQAALLARHLPARRGGDRARQLGRRPGCAAPAASTGPCTTCSCRSGARWCMPACRSTTNGSAGRA